MTAGVFLACGYRSRGGSLELAAARLLHIDGLDIDELLDAVLAEFPSVARLLHTAKRKARIGSDGKSSVDRLMLNRIYADSAAGTQKGLLVYSEDQNVSADVQGRRAAVVIEASETHTRTGFVEMDLAGIPGLERKALEHFEATRVHVPVLTVLVNVTLLVPSKTTTLPAMLKKSA